MHQPQFLTVTSDSVLRRGMFVRRRWWIVAMLWVVVQFGAPVRAFAMFGWLDHLSGPGPFRGTEFQLRLLCVMKKPSIADAIEAFQAADRERLSVREQLVAVAPGPNAAGLLSQDLRKAISELPQTQSLQVLQTALGPPEGLYTPTTIAGIMSQSGVNVTELLKLAGDSQKIAVNARNAITPLFQSGSSAVQMMNLQIFALATRLERSAQLLREAAVPRVREIPGGVIWASCLDHPNAYGEVYKASRDEMDPDRMVHRADRHPLLSVNFNYREYTNGQYFIFDPSKNQGVYAGGHTIHLSIFEPQLSWPVTGRLDILDAQAGMGVYWFRSQGFPNFKGLIVEPLRFDLHFPARLMDGKKNPLLAILYSFSARWGFVTFPGGFSAAAFNATGPAARDISGGEVLFDKGIVIDVGRLFGK